MRFRIALLLILLAFPAYTQQLEYTVDVQLVDLQVSVLDEKGRFVEELSAEDFTVFEDGVAQEVLELEDKREPFSIGILLDTSSSMQSVFQEITRASNDFLSSLSPSDEYFLMAFDERIRMLKSFESAATPADEKLRDLHFGEGTKLFDALEAASLKLKESRYPRRALFLISDGVNTRGRGSLSDAIRAAQSAKVLVYALVVEKGDSDLFTIRKLVESTGGTYFLLYDEFPRLRAAYEKIAFDLAHKRTLVYHSTSDYSRAQKPEIHVQMKNPRWKVRHQKAYYSE